MIEIFEYSKLKSDESLIKNLFEIQKKEMPILDQMDWHNFLLEFSESSRFYFVAREEDKIVGYIGLTNMIDCFDIIGICVDSKYQRKGVGGQLLLKAFGYAKNKKIDKIFLEVDEKNTKAIEFYKKNGFVLTNIRKKYYKDNDAYVFVRIL